MTFLGIFSNEIGFLYKSPNEANSTPLEAIRRIPAERGLRSILEISGYRVILIDTAGCWKSNEEIERVGIQKTKEEIGRADIVLFLGENKTDLKLIKELNIKKDLITILSKCDINKSKEYNIAISSNKGVGFKELLTALSTKIEASCAINFGVLRLAVFVNNIVENNNNSDFVFFSIF